MRTAADQHMMHELLCMLTDMGRSTRLQNKHSGPRTEVGAGTPGKESRMELGPLGKRAGWSWGPWEGEWDRAGMRKMEAESGSGQ